MVVFSMRDREASGAAAGDLITVILELDDGYRHVDVPAELDQALELHGLRETFRNLNYSKRKEFARQINDAKTDETRARRIQKIVTMLKTS